MKPGIKRLFQERHGSSKNVSVTMNFAVYVTDAGKSERYFIKLVLRVENQSGFGWQRACISTRDLSTYENLTYGKSWNVSLGFVPR